MRELYIGLMSGTSMDAVDAALVDLSGNTVKLLASYSTPLPEELRNNLTTLCMPGANEINRMGALDIQVGELFAQTVMNLLRQANVSAKEICAIGSHGQTIRHQPQGKHPFTLQIGDPNVIAEQTGITTVADFRRRDMSKGGQGAPLTPSFHNHVFRDPHEDRIVINIGGIANITWLPADINLPVIGFDTGPGNTLLDTWIWQELQKTYDEDGDWAKSGKIDSELLTTMLSDPYFHLPPPKSTGREYFNLNWLTSLFPVQKIAAQDIQATLCELTAVSISRAVTPLTSESCALMICGGGIKNSYLIERLQANCPQHHVHSTEVFGVPPAWVEAMAWAWLAQQTLAGKPSNLPSVTGATKEVILGGIYKTMSE